VQLVTYLTASVYESTFCSSKASKSFCENKPGQEQFKHIIHPLSGQQCATVTQHTVQTEWLWFIHNPFTWPAHFV